MTSQQPENPHFAEADAPDTEVISMAGPASVFVDSTGRRSRLLRRLAYAFGVLVMLYGGLISVSLAGGPVHSSAVLPLPGLEPEDAPEPPAVPSPTPAPNADPTHTAKAVVVADAIPRHIPAPRVAPPRLESTAVAAKSAKPTPSKTPKPIPTTTKPTESTTTPPTSAPTSSPTTTPPTTPAPSLATKTPPPLAPAVSTGTGGASSNAGVTA